MIYPFIYTRTKYYDYRVVTSKSLSNVSHSFVHFATEIARTLIDAENDQLSEPSWALVKKDGYTIWGMAIVNKELGDQSQDKYRRPVRGFFGFISDGAISKLPYSASFFKDLYAKYVLPIWDSYEQTEQITESIQTISSLDFIERSFRLISEINVNNSICRIIPNTSDSKSLIEAVLASSDDCSIATNIHRKNQCVDFGKDKFSFTNAVMSSDSRISHSEDVKVFVPQEKPTIIEDVDNGRQEQSDRTLVGDHENFDGINIDGQNNKINKKYIKYGLYGFMALICLLLMFNGSSIWERLLSPKKTYEIVRIEEDKTEGHSGRVKSDSYFLNTTKHEVNISDANPNDVFMIAYESSSLLSRVNSANNWIRVITPSQKFSKKGVIEFTCEPLIRGRREGAICLSNEEGVKVTIPIYQSVSAEDGAIENATQSVRPGGNKSETQRNVIISEPQVDVSVDGHNFGMSPTAEPTNH